MASYKYLKNEEALVQRKLHYERGDKRQSRNKYYRNINDKLVKQVQGYNGENKLEFLKAVAYNLHIF